MEEGMLVEGHDERCSVLVVGAGIAGLAASVALARAGVEVVCVEARPRVGGRLLSMHTAEGALDLGSTWFWSGERRIERLVRTLAVAVHDQYLEGDALEERPEGRRRLTGNPIDVPSYRYTHGAQGLAEALAATLSPGVVQLETVVSGIDADRTGLVVHTRQAERRDQIRASQVVMAVPPALAVHAISFQPGLATPILQLARLTPVWMGSMTKVVVHFSEPFWREDGLAGAAVSHLGPLRELHDMSGPGGRPAALFGFAPALANKVERTEELVIAQLMRLYGPLAASPRRVIIQRWGDEEYTSPPDVESLNAYQLFGHPMYAKPALGGRLHWAATETAQESPSHVEGALAGAERAVAGVLSNL